MRLQAFWEARWILAFLALLAIVFGLFSAWAFWFFVLLLLCTIAFFRDPDRAAPVDPNVIVAAADGTVMDIVELDENEVLKNKTRRSEEHTSELQSPDHLVCRLLLEKKK